MENHLYRNLPLFNSEEVSGLARELFSIEGELFQQNAERDLSYRIKSASGESYVIKISNSAELEGLIDMQVQALEHIAEQDSTLTVPRMVHSVNGRAYEWVEAHDGTRHMVRVLTFLEGDVIEDTPAAHKPETRYECGAFMGRLNLALRNFFHAHAGSNKHLWDLGRALDIRDLTQHLQDTDLRKLCDTVFDRAERDTLPRLRRLRHQLIHQDAHSGNVLVCPDDSNKIAGLIDFGDMLYGPVISELVVAADSYTPDDKDPLQILCDVAAGFDSNSPLEEDEIDLIYDLALIRLAMTVTIIHSRDALDSSDAHIANDGKFDHVLRLMCAYGSESATRRLRDACRFPVYSNRNSVSLQPMSDHRAELAAKREQNLGKVWHFYQQPLNFTRGSGAWLYTADGTAYLDAYNNVPQFGHSNPYIVRAIARQAAALNTNTRYLCDIVADYAERLTADLPDHLDTCIFVNSGSEANDFAMQIARAVSGNFGGIVQEYAYHGCTDLTGALSPHAYTRKDWLATLQNPDNYRGPYAGQSDAAECYAADTNRAIADLSVRGHKPAAYMVDTALCSNGVPDVPANYFNLVAEKCKAAGALVIADEVQAGCGRMGGFWGFRCNGLNDENVDIITMGKPVANGHPLGVVILSRKLLERFQTTVNNLFSTFGGNTVSCAAGMAVLDVIDRENLIEKCNEVGDYLRAELHKLAQTQPLIGSIRGRGMLTGLEFVTNRETKCPATSETALLLELMRENKVLVGSEGEDNNILKLRPSLAWNRANVDTFIQALDKSLTAIASEV